MTNQQPYRVAVMISGNGSNLQSMIDYFKHHKNVKIVLVVSNKKEAYGVERANKANIPVAIVESTKERDIDEQRLIKAIDAAQADLVVMAGFMRILTPLFIEHYKNKLLNIHPSLLPKYKGLNTHQRVLADNEKKHGCTVHLVTNELDGGPVIAQAELTIEPNETADQLQQRVHQLEHGLYPRVIESIALGDLKLEKENQ